MQDFRKKLLFLVCTLPQFKLLFDLALDKLGANPQEALLRGLGEWTLWFLLITLALTPLRIILKTPQIMRYRRMLGLFSFYYACLHALAYIWFNFSLNFTDIWEDIFKRPFIFLGSAGLLLLLPLAATSFNRAIRWLGAKRWKQLHRLVYVAATLAILHFVWMRSSKNNYFEPLVYAAILALLFAVRIWHRQRTRLRQL